jgi:subtilisin family serine protease
MKSRIAFFSLLLFLFAAATHLWAAAAASRNTGREAIPHVVVVKVKPGLQKSSGSGINEWQQSAAIDRLQPVMPSTIALKKQADAWGLDRVYYAYYSDDRSPAEVARIIQADPSVEYAEPKYVQHLCAVPNDSLYTQQSVYLLRLKMAEAWNLAKGENGSALVAIVDGGTSINHPDLAANIWINNDEIPNNGKDDDQNGFVDDINGWNFANGSADPTGLANTPLNAEHGTHVAGICGAVTNNQKGVAGSSWNAKVMAINTSSPYSDNAIVYGYDGILYAANNGADIINCSWGTLGSASLYEQDVVQYALQRGSVIVAAAGNDNDSTFHYPSSYEGVLSVAALAAGNLKASFSNYGKAIDVAVPGVTILGPVGANGYKTMSGTSMASPLAAGIVALVKSAHPSWNGRQAAEQVRMTCINIDPINVTYKGKLGRGLVDAQAALTTVTPSIRIDHVRFVDENGDGVIKPGERVQIYLSLVNYLTPATAVQISLQEDSPYADLISSTATLSSIQTMQTLELATPFVLQVHGDAPRGHLINFTLDLKGSKYSDTDQFNLLVLPTFGNIEINHLATSVTNVGRLGFGNTDASVDGIGFKYQKGPNLIFEGAIICGTGADRISNCARGVVPPGKTSVMFDNDFATTADGDLQFRTPGLFTDQESAGTFDDRNADRPMNVRITQKTFANQSGPYRDFILFEYDIQNTGTETLTPFHFGFLFDWDIDGGHYDTNMASYDPSRRMGYAYDTGAGPDTYVGLAFLDKVNTSHRAIYNDQKNPNNKTWGLYDGFSDAEKWEAISGGNNYSEAGPADISHVVSAGPFTLQPQEHLVLKLVLAAGEGLEQLHKSVDTAQSFASALSASSAPTTPLAWQLEHNYPNPFNASTEIRYTVPKAAQVRLAIYDVLGRQVRVLSDSYHHAGQHALHWDGLNEDGFSVPSGTYFCRLQAKSQTLVRKLTLIR